MENEMKMNKITENIAKMSTLGQIHVKFRYGNDFRKVVIHNEDIPYDDIILMIKRIYKDEIPNINNIFVKYLDEDNDLITMTDSSQVSMAIIKRDDKDKKMDLRIFDSKELANKSFLNENVNECGSSLMESIHSQLNTIITILNSSKEEKDVAVKRQTKPIISRMLETENKKTCTTPISSPLSIIPTQSEASIPKVPAFAEKNDSYNYFSRQNTTQTNDAYGSAFRKPENPQYSDQQQKQTSYTQQSYADNSKYGNYKSPAVAPLPPQNAYQKNFNSPTQRFNQDVPSQQMQNFPQGQYMPAFGDKSQNNTFPPGNNIPMPGSNQYYPNSQQSFGNSQSQPELKPKEFERAPPPMSSVPQMGDSNLNSNPYSRRANDERSMNSMPYHYQ
ncbi:hypothetical protein A3Q56_01735 [Intoshia linei]|uniref:PB1 domain-containing protein n=1 Tax=Intoshia linei TaxID=1819745 RepID=A0A177BA36_9BILA|nr:hypothetical protein A3Q56_01735 [Intoshia linei]